MVHDKHGNRDQLRSSVGGEVEEIDELLMLFRDAIYDADAMKGAEKICEKELVDEKERVGKALAGIATRRSVSDTADGRGKASAVDYSFPRTRKALRVVGTAGEMERFAIHLRDGDLAKIEFDQENIAFKKENLTIEKTEKEKKRE